jgi:pimeloyl-ACP methyl ester carboxylesterase
MGVGSGDVPHHRVVRDDPAAHEVLDPADRQGFEDYFVVRTPATARRYRDHVLPGTTAVDETALERIFAGWKITLGPEPFTGPALIVAGRRDSIVGLSQATELLDFYPHATLAVLENAGHAVIHEQPELLAALLGDWLDRVGSGGAYNGP